jgi:hypothetical protein
MNLPYQEGTVFAVPLRTDGFGLGVVARVAPDGSGAVLGYFFGPRYKTLQDMHLPDLPPLRAKDALKVWRFGDPFLLDGSWPMIGKLKDWDRSEWPIPYFMWKDQANKTAWLIRYSDESISNPASQARVPYESNYEPDGGYGAGSIEILLSRFL